MKKQRGLTLVEIMIALGIGSLVIAGAVQILTSSRQNYRTIESLSRIQEDARFVMESMAFDLRMTGYQVCGETVGKANVIAGASGTWYLDLFGSTLEGYESGAGLSDLPTSGEGTPVAGTDAVAFKSIGLDDTYYVQSHNPTTTVIQLNKTSSFAKGEVAVICDENQTAVFQVSTDTGSSSALVHNTGGSESPGNCTKFLGASCGEPATEYEFSSSAQVFHVNSYIYYIGIGADGVTPGLYRAELKPDGSKVLVLVPQLVVPNIVNMQLEYGVDSDSDQKVDSYEAADAVTDWGSVLSVRVNLLFRSKQDILVPAGEEQSYTLNGVTSTATDRRIYRVFSTTIGIRNRLQ